MVPARRPPKTKALIGTPAGSSHDSSSAGFRVAGEVNREIVDLMNEHGDGLAVGVFGDGSSLFTGEKKGVVVDGEHFDLGHVGDITHVDPSGVLAAIEAGRCA